MPCPVIISLPIEDRRAAFTFYRDGLGFEPIGDIADDGLPEPLQFAVNDGLRIMLIPTGGFGWVIGDHEVAPRRTSEALINLTVATPSAVDAMIDRAVNAGGTVNALANQYPWGYAGNFADPDGHLWMVTTALD